MPVLVVTSTGRRTGRARVTPIAYWPYRDGWTVIATNAGSDRHPGWVHNLRADPACTVEVGGRRIASRAREAVGSERAEIWSEMVTHCPRYDVLAEEASVRQVPVVVFEPAVDTIGG